MITANMANKLVQDYYHDKFVKFFDHPLNLNIRIQEEARRGLRSLELNEKDSEEISNFGDDFFVEEMECLGYTLDMQEKMVGDKYITLFTIRW
jgi:hypothetical protein